MVMLSGKSGRLAFTGIAPDWVGTGGGVGCAAGNLTG